MQMICSEGVSSGCSDGAFSILDTEVTNENTAQPAKWKDVLQEEANCCRNRLQSTKQFFFSAGGKNINPLCWPKIKISVLKQLSFQHQASAEVWCAHQDHPHEIGSKLPKINLTILIGTMQAD